MAIYHFSVKPISRDKGQSSVASAAYRAAEKLYDERLDKVFDYSKKQGVVHQEILLPDGAPAALQDRGKLWNLVEATEKRKDSQLARDINMSLPRELTREQNITLAREYIQQNFVSLGMVADFAIHEEKTKDGKLQPHVHVMLSMRSVGPDGFGKKVRDWNDKAFLMLWRETWAEGVNKHLALNGHEMRIDHRSLQEQGIDLEPQYQKGAVRASVELARAEEHRRIAKENGDKILQDPTIALHAITQQQATFTHQDIARFVHRHSVDAEQFKAVYEKVKASPELVSLGKDEHSKERYTTREMQGLEMEMFGHVADLDHKANHRVSPSLVDEVIASRTLSPEQEVALKHITLGTDIASVVGFAGTGKSYMLGAAREVWEKAGFRVIGATLSGIAAESLESSSGIKSRTLASLTYAWDKGYEKLGAKDVVVIDEAGMLGTKQKARIMAEVAKAGAKVVPVGDPEQLQAIAAGAAFRGIVERTGYIELSDIRRQTVPWQKEATKEFATKQTEVALGRYAANKHIHGFATLDDAKKAIINDWNYDDKYGKTSLILAYTREDVKSLNELARAEKRKFHELGTDKLVQTARGERLFATGDRIYFLKNDNELGVKNGTLGTIDYIDKNKLTVRLDAKGETKARHITFSSKRYNDFDHGYAATIHKSQGVTINHAYLLASPYIDSHGVYVAGSRHTDTFNLYYSREQFANEQKLIQSLSRQRDKDLVVDYSKSEQSPIPTLNQVEQTKSLKPDLRGLAAAEFQADLAKIRGQRQTHTPSFAATTMAKERTMPQHNARLQQYQTEFEARYPSMTKAIQQSITPGYVHKATDALRTWQAYESDLTNNMSRRVKDTMQSYAAELKQKQPEVMQYLKLHHPDMGQRIESFAKAHQIEKDIGEISL